MPGKRTGEREKKVKSMGEKKRRRNKWKETGKARGMYKGRNTKTSLKLTNNIEEESTQGQWRD